jgi:hypothetical protein
MEVWLGHRLEMGMFQSRSVARRRKGIKLCRRRRGRVGRLVAVRCRSVRGMNANVLVIW